MGYNGAYVFVLFSQDGLHNTQKSIRYFSDRRANGSIQSLVFWAESIGEPDSKYQDIDYRRAILFDSAGYECDRKIGGVANGDTGNMHFIDAIYWDHTVADSKLGFKLVLSLRYRVAKYNDNKKIQIVQYSSIVIKCILKNVRASLFESKIFIMPLRSIYL